MRTEEERRIFSRPMLKVRKIIVLTHGKFAEGIVDSLRMILGPQQHISPICIHEDDAGADVQARLTENTKDLSDNDNIIIITDIVGGSSTNAALMFARTRDNTFVVAGLNLPLLIEIASSDDTDSSAVINESIDVARESIVNLDYILKECSRS